MLRVFHITLNWTRAWRWFELNNFDGLRATIHRWRLWPPWNVLELHTGFIMRLASSGRGIYSRSHSSSYSLARQTGVDWFASMVWIQGVSGPYRHGNNITSLTMLSSNTPKTTDWRQQNSTLGITADLYRLHHLRSQVFVYSELGQSCFLTPFYFDMRLGRRAWRVNAGSCEVRLEQMTDPPYRDIRTIPYIDSKVILHICQKPSTYTDYKEQDTQQVSLFAEWSPLEVFD